MYSFSENKAVGRLTELIALERGCDPKKAKQIGNAAVLHDIGKQKIQKSILEKPGKLTAGEFEIMKKHTDFGVEILTSIKGDIGELAREICYFHHEWFMPSLGGYRGVSTLYLPDYISYVAISDVYTSLISERPYKSKWRKADALAYIESKSGTQFCPDLVKLFASLIRNDSRVPAIFAGV